MTARLFLIFSAVLSAQPALDAPPIARVLDREGALTPIHGLAGNFIPGEPGPALLAYSNDGVIEWRLEPGRLTATQAGQTAVFSTTATRAVFRGDSAVLPESNESLRLVGDSLLNSSDEPTTQLAGRLIEWRDGKLHIFQADGSEEIIACLHEPEAMTAAAAHWAHLTIGGQAHLLRLTAGRVELFVLPHRSRQ
ncbi:MAG TPA: hypothetical protein VFQ91_24440 [Bryobacteraceae bacterium]|nr:hypothetical protein [Bryobacteraceae bacterium]